MCSDWGCNKEAAAAECMFEHAALQNGCDHLRCTASSQLCIAHTPSHLHTLSTGPRHPRRQVLSLAPMSRISAPDSCSLSAAAYRSVRPAGSAYVGSASGMLLMVASGAVLGLDARGGGTPAKFAAPVAAAAAASRSRSSAAGSGCCGCCCCVCCGPGCDCVARTPGWRDHLSCVLRLLPAWVATQGPGLRG